jgi:hypothetical protein
MKIGQFRYFVSLVLIVLGSAATAEDRVWMIGGGPELGGSQAQIELNVQWILRVLESAPGERTIKVYYTSGNDPEIDIVEWVPPEDSDQNLVPLARVYGTAYENGEIFRRNRLQSIDGSTRRDELLAALQAEFAQLKAGDRGLILFNGHGLVEFADFAENNIRVWGDEVITAREFETLLSGIAPGVTSRFVFSQCFSGGFERLVYKDAEDTLELAEGRRCGFMAESPTRESEGCSASVRIGDYRDYTTYFFAALKGETRLGEPVSEKRDIDGDGQISLLDAHLFTQVYGMNGDLPRSTSETYLEKWQPWWLRWMDTRSMPDNLYGRLATELGTAIGLPAGSAREAALAAYARRADLLSDTARAENRHSDNAEIIRQLQGNIRDDIERRWPALANPYTAAYFDAVAADIETIQDSIVRHAGYSELVKLHESQGELQKDLLAYDREIAQIDRTLRLRRLGRILDQFERFADAEAKASYEQLRSCEAEPL